MTKTELWDIIVERNPSFVEGPVKMTAERFRKLFDLVWELAVEHEAERLDNIRSADLPQVLQDIFGGLK